MKNQLKKMLAILLAGAMALSLAACGGDSSSTSSGSTDSSKTDSAGSATSEDTASGEEGNAPDVIEITGFAWDGTGSSKVEFGDRVIFDLAEEATGVRVNFEVAPTESFQEKLSLKFASNQIPDVLFKCNIQQADITKYTAEGTFVAMDDYWDEIPNFKSYMDNDPSIIKSIRQSDGKVYGFPYLVTASPSRISPKMFINEKWMKAQKLKMPTTLDEFYELLKQMKEYDFNGNGEADEIPLTCSSALDPITALAGSFGLLNRGTAQTIWDIDPVSGELRCVRTAPEYKAELEYLNKLYTEKLMDQEYFTNDIAAVTAKSAQNILGVVFCHNNNYMGDYASDYTNFEAPLIGPDGDQMFSGRTNPVAGQNTFVTKNNPYPAETFRWIDWFYSAEGIAQYFMGIEGTTWENDSNGEPQFTDLVTNNPDGRGQEEVLAEYTVWGGGANPSVADDLHFGNHLIPEITVNAAQAMMDYTPEEIWGTFNYSVEDSARLSELKTDIDSYIDEMAAKFITGEAGFEQWDDYCSRIEAMGLDEYRQIVQRALDNYENN